MKHRLQIYGENSKKKNLSLSIFRCIVVLLRTRRTESFFTYFIRCLVLGTCLILRKGTVVYINLLRFTHDGLYTSLFMILFNTSHPLDEMVVYFRDYKDRTESNTICDLNPKLLLYVFLNEKILYMTSSMSKLLVTE